MKNSVSGVMFALACVALAPRAIAAPLMATNIPNIFVYPSPPAYFDAAHASPSGLATYGLPHRPDPVEGSAARRRWEAVIRAQRVQPTLQATSIVQGPARHTSLPGGFHEQGSTQGSENWSGETLLNNANGYGPGAFTSVAGTFNVPVAIQAFGVCTGGWDYLGTWAGIDGWSANEVFQAGTESDAYCANGNTQSFYSAWVEWYPGNMVRITNMPVAPGDIMLSWMIADSATTGRAILLNETTNQVVIMSLTAPAGYGLKGDSVEWIMERPTVNNVIATMSNYVEAYLSDEKAAIQGNSQIWNFGSTPLGATAFLITMYDSSNTVLSSATPAGGAVAEFTDSGSAK